MALSCVENMTQEDWDALPEYRKKQLVLLAKNKAPKAPFFTQDGPNRKTRRSAWYKKAVAEKTKENAAQAAKAVEAMAINPDLLDTEDTTGESVE